MRISSLLSALPQTSLLTSARALRLVALTLSGAMFLSQSAFAANTGQSVGNPATRAAGEWSTAVVVPNPSGIAGLKCQQSLKASGVASQSGPYAELQARHEAIETWRTEVSQRFGEEFMHWWRAREKDVSCQSKAGGTSCVAIAMPCKPEAGGGEPFASRSGLGVR